MPISYVDPLTRSFDRMKQILFRPFDPVVWLVIGFAAWLAGLAGRWTSAGITNPRDTSDEPLLAFSDAWRDLVEHAWLIPLVIVMVALALALVVLLLWISSRGKMVFLDAVVRNRAEIVEPWRRLRHIGNSLFVWRLGLAFVVMLITVTVAAAFFIPAATVSVNDALRSVSFATMFLGGMLLLGLGLALAVISVLLDGFVVPLMYRFNLTATAAWRALLPWLGAHAGAFVAYVVLVMVAHLVFAFLFAVACLASCCMLAIPYVGTVLLLPFHIVYRAYSIEFMAQLDPRLDLFSAAAAVTAAAP